MWITFCLELFTVFFQHENRFRYKFFRYCSIFKVLCASALSADDLIILPQKRFFVKRFFWEAFELFWTWSASYISVSTGVFQRLLVLFKGFLLGLQKSFFYLSAWRSSIIPHPAALVNTFWHLFSNFFAEGVNSLSQSLRLCQLPLRGSLWRGGKVFISPETLAIGLTACALSV